MASPNGRRLNLDALRKQRAAAAVESARERYPFTFGGREFSLAPADDWPANAKALLANGDLAEVLDAVLDDPAAFWAVEPRPTVADVNELIAAWGEWAGVGDLGESVGSPPRVSSPT